MQKKNLSAIHVFHIKNYLLEQVSLLTIYIEQCAIVSLLTCSAMFPLLIDHHISDFFSPDTVLFLMDYQRICYTWSYSADIESRTINLNVSQQLPDGEQRRKHTTIDLEKVCYGYVKILDFLFFFIQLILAILLYEPQILACALSLLNVEMIVLRCHMSAKHRYLLEYQSVSILTKIVF